MYGGAATELHHQIILWKLGFPELELHIIPTQQGFKNEPLYPQMINMGIIYEGVMDFSQVTKDDAVINFCSSAFLENIETINERTDRTVFVNCMTWLFDLEKKQASKNNIKFHLYQRPQVRDEHAFYLKKLGSNAEFIHFSPYFDASSIKFSVKDQGFTNIGRISRQDADKFSKDTVSIYHGIVSPKMKRGHFLGFKEDLIKKIGNIPDWIQTYRNHERLSVEEFYDRVDFLVQSTDTTENWPRVGFEAMFSGKPLVVNNRGGWQYMIDHGVNGFLCNDYRDFVYYGSRMSYDDEYRHQIAENALRKAKELSSFETSKESWSQVFEKVYA